MPKTIPIRAWDDWLCNPDDGAGDARLEGVAVGAAVGAIDNEKSNEKGSKIVVKADIWEVNIDQMLM